MNQLNHLGSEIVGMHLKGRWLLAHYTGPVTINLVFAVSLLTQDSITDL